MSSHAGTRQNRLTFRKPGTRRINQIAVGITGHHPAKRFRLPLALPIPQRLHAKNGGSPESGNQAVVISEGVSGSPERLAQLVTVSVFLRLTKSSSVSVRILLSGKTWEGSLQLRCHSPHRSRSRGD